MQENIVSQSYCSIPRYFYTGPHETGFPVRIWYMVNRKRRGYHLTWTGTCVLDICRLMSGGQIYPIGVNGSSWLPKCVLV